MNRIYALCDANSFYASVEELFDPKIRGRPVVVASNNDGCVVARSKAAKKIGIKMGVPIFQVKDLVKTHGLIIRSSNYALYGDLSARFMQTLEHLAPVIPYSIDEAFLDLTGVQAHHSLPALGHEIKSTVARWVGLPICVGISTSLTLAKLANHAAKQYPATQGVVDLTDTERQTRLLAITPVEEVWGIGRKLSARLKGMGIATALDLRDADAAWIRKHFSVVVERTVWDLRGIASHQMDDMPDAKQQILCSRSFGTPVTRREDLISAATSFAVRASEKLRGESRVANRIQAFCSTSRFNERPRYSNSASKKLPFPTADSRLIAEATKELISSLWREGFHYTKAGVMLSEFEMPGESQGDLFGERSDSPQSEKLMSTIDSINKSGKGNVCFGRQAQKEKVWAMARRNLSPAYTTRWTDIPKVKS